jgi:hypothetical protein
MAIHPEDNAQPMSHKKPWQCRQTDMSYIVRHEYQPHQDSG